MSAHVFAPAPDIELALLTLLRENFPALATEEDGQLRVATEFPPDVGQVVGADGFFTRVTNISPRNDRFTANGQVDFDVLGRRRTATRDLAVAIEAWLLGYPHRTTVDGDFVLLEEVFPTLSPHRVRYEDSTLSRYFSSYRISARR